MQRNLDCQKFHQKEITSWLLDYLERTGLGLTLWFYDAGNPNSKAAALEAAREQGRNTNIVWPRGTAGPNTGAGVERLETSVAGSDIIMRVMEYFDAAQERFIIGQSMSGGADNESGLGGTGRAEFAADLAASSTRSSGIGIPNITCPPRTHRAAHRRTP